MNKNKSLVFVYNADSGLFNTVTDIAHKIFSPDTYACNLCAITHGYFQMQGEWKAFIEELDHPLEFLHRDEFIQQYPEQELALPAIFQKQGDELVLWINQTDINQCKTIDELKALIKSRL